MDTATDASPSQTCAACGGIRLTWRVKRHRAPGGNASLRTLAWHCRDCQVDWEEPLSTGDASPQSSRDEIVAG